MTRRPDPGDWMKPLRFGEEPAPEQAADERPAYDDGYGETDDDNVLNDGGVEGINDNARRSVARMKCPKCGQNNELDVAATIFMRISKTGCRGEIHWGSGSGCRCPECGWEGEFHETQASEESE